MLFTAVILLSSLLNCCLADGADEVRWIERRRDGFIVGKLTKRNFCLHTQQKQHVRRAARSSDVQCIPLLKVTQYDHDSYHPGPHTEWNCQLLSNTPAAKGKRGKIIKLDKLYNLPTGTVQKFKSGASVLTVSGATVNSAGIHIPRGAAASVKESDEREKLPTKIVRGDDGFLTSGKRKLQTGNVDKKVLVVRVKTLTSATTASADTISDEVFGTDGDPFNLSSQYEACSYGKLTMSPLKTLNPGDPALHADGVYEVEVTTSTTDHELLRELITDKLNADFVNTLLPDNSWGKLDDSVLFDHVMYCMPPDVTNMGIACK